MLDAEVGQAALPLEQAVVILDDQGEVMRPADAGLAARCVRPLEKGDRRAGFAGLVAEIEVIAAGIVKIDRLFDEAQPEHLRVEIDRPLRVRADQRYVMQSEDRHNRLSFPL